MLSKKITPSPMTWQDIVITIANIIFTIALVPQIHHGFSKKTGPIKLITSIPIATALYGISIAYWSVGLYSSSVISMFTGAMWIILVVQNLIYKKK